jgi:phosphatidate phosphatase PAH1
MPKSNKANPDRKNNNNAVSGGGSWLGWGWGKSKSNLQAQSSAPNTPLVTNVTLSSLKNSENSTIKQAVVDTTTTITTTTTIEMKSRTSLNLEGEPSMMLDEEMLNSQFKPYVNNSPNFSQDLPFQKKIKYRKITRLSTEQIEKLNLKPGPNEIKFSVTTALQGTTRIVSYIFLWNYDDKIIVSDIDGTITKSDVWGQVLPIFGRDWSQAGVADLFTAIERNEYKFIYLSARAIGQSKITRDLLRSINQDGFKLPEGPLLVTPTSLFIAFQKEVIEKKPEEFKISCLKDIQSLFSASNNPYYAGYGNKSTDVTAYKSVGIPVSRIFTINPQGEIKHETSRMFQSSYSKLCDYVDLIFPPFKANTIIKPDYDSFNYWRSPQPSAFMDEIEKELEALNVSKDAKVAKVAKVNPKDKKGKAQVPAIAYENDVESFKKKINES